VVLASAIEVADNHPSPFIDVSTRVHSDWQLATDNW
jgi:hypothetical protein